MGFVATTLRMTAGIIVWAVHFAAIYGYAALACARGFAVPVPAVVGIATILALDRFRFSIGLMSVGSSSGRS